MKRILFVDDDVNVLNGLRRGLNSMRGEWQMEFAHSGEMAMGILEKMQPDALITDVRMRQMGGFQLLREVQEAYPHILRIALSGQTEQDALAQSLTSTHLFLPKPCDAEFLKHRVRNILARGDKLRDPMLKSLVARLRGVASVPQLFGEIVALFNSDNSEIDRIAPLVAMDMGMSATVLHFVNSGYFGPGAVTSNPERAVRWLGLETVRDLILRHGLCYPFDGNGFEYFDLSNLWNSSVSTAASACAIGFSRSKDTVLADDSYAAGLFHDIGQVVLASVLGPFYDGVIGQAISRGEPLPTIEREMIGSTHAEVGAYLLGLWGMPDTVVAAVESHHSSLDDDAEEFTPLTAIRISHQAAEAGVCKTRY